MSQFNKARQFAALHVRGTPIFLYNAWDAGSARAIVDAGAKAIATSSWSVAAAQGFKDGEALPLGHDHAINRVPRLSFLIDLGTWFETLGQPSGATKQESHRVARALQAEHEQHGGGRGVLEFRRERNDIRRLLRSC